MNTLIWTTIWGTLGGFIAWKIGFPGGAAVGAMLGSGIYNLIATNIRMPMPVPLELAAQIAVGVVIGSTFSRELLYGGISVFVWGLIGAFTYLLVGLTLAWIASRFGYLAFDTALFSFSPGGFTGMSILAGAEGANPAKVSLIHFTRVVLLFIIVPLMVRLLAHL
jgi:hypothetical protein